MPPQLKAQQHLYDMHYSIYCNLQFSHAYFLRKQNVLITFDDVLL